MGRGEDRGEGRSPGPHWLHSGAVEAAANREACVTVSRRDSRQAPGASGHTGGSLGMSEAVTGRRENTWARATAGNVAACSRTI